MPATPTVSVWPQSISERPGARAVQHADDVGPARRHLGDVDVEADATASPRRAAARSPASPRAPGTSDGFTESMATRSLSRRRSASGVAPCGLWYNTGRHQRRAYAHELAVILVWGRHGRRARPCARPAGARSWSAAGCAIGCWGAPRRTWTSRCSASPATGCTACCAAWDGSSPSAELPRLQGGRDSATATIDVALPRRESKPGRGHKGFVVEGDPSMSVAGRGAPPRLHRQRDRLGSADRRLRGSVRRPRRPRRDGCCARWIRRRSATTACACCAPSSSRRASSSRWTTDTAALCRAHPARRSARRARLGRAREAARCRRGRPSIGPGAGAGPRRRGRACCRSCGRWSAARRSRSGTRKATSGCTR